MFTVVLSVELGELIILLKASSVLPFNSSDSVGSVAPDSCVVGLLLGVVLDSILELGIVLLTVVVPAPTELEVLLAEFSET